jgi:hypothetical protein
MSARTDRLIDWLTCTVTISPHWGTELPNLIRPRTQVENLTFLASNKARNVVSPRASGRQPGTACFRGIPAFRSFFMPMAGSLLVPSRTYPHRIPRRARCGLK